VRQIMNYVKNVTLLLYTIVLIVALRFILIINLPLVCLFLTLFLMNDLLYS